VVFAAVVVNRFPCSYCTYRIPLIVVRNQRVSGVFQRTHIIVKAFFYYNSQMLKNKKALYSHLGCGSSPSGLTEAFTTIEITVFATERLESIQF